MSRLTPASVLLAAASAGCQFDLDKIYEHEVPGGDAGADAAMDMPLPSSLIGLFEDPAFQASSCQSCAREKCAAAEQDCRASEECTALTRCVARSTDPDTQAGCRAGHVDWLAESPNPRALGGPYYACVFRDKCADQCQTHTDWSCLGNYSWEPSSESKVAVTFQFASARPPRDPAKDVAFKVCSLHQDLACASPYLEGVKTDAMGMLTMDLPISASRAFAGYLEIPGDEDWYPQLIRFGWPLSRSNAMYLPIVDKVAVGFFGAAAEVKPDPALGMLQIRMFGCAGVGMSGVYFTASNTDDKTTYWYAIGDTVSFSANSTGPLGSGGVINVKPGSVEVVARLREDDSEVARTQAPVRAGYLTIVILAPAAR